MYRFCNFVYAWLVDRVQDKDRFEYELNMPLEGQRSEQVSESMVDAENSAFFAFSGMAAADGGTD